MLTDFVIVAGGVAAGGVMVFLYRRYRGTRRLQSRRQSPTDWKFYRVLPFSFVRLKDGSVATFEQLVMRRRLADGLWEYRWPTEAEAYEEWESGWW